MSDKPRLTHQYGTINKDYATHLATRPPHEDGPIFMVNLMKYHAVAQYATQDSPGKSLSGREADERYNPVSILSKIGATIVFVGDVISNHVGDEDWDRIAVVRYPTRKSFIEMQNRKDFGEKHVHKAAGMQRTIIAGCRPQDSSLDLRGRPRPDDDRLVAMVVRQTTDRIGALTLLPDAVNFTVEGTVIGDGRPWDTVQFVAVDALETIATIATRLDPQPASSAYVVGIRASMDAITQE